MLLTEIFNRVMPWKVREHRPDYFDATFMINDIKYIFRASAYLNNGEEVGNLTEWDIEFYPDLDIPREKKYGILGKTGNELPVFATVVDIFREWVKEYQPKVITFSANEPSRKKLYTRMVTTLLPNWDTEETRPNQITVYRA